jgi:hypothetical protein
MRRSHVISGVIALAAAVAALAVAVGGGREGGHGPVSPARRNVLASARGRARGLDPGPLGVEAVPVPAARSLAPAGAPARGRTVDGITSAPSEQLAFHVHAHLAVFVAGAPRRIPNGVGIAPPLQVQSTARGPFATGGAGISWLHTHAPDGIIHIEAPAGRRFTLGNFFDIWGEPLGPDLVGPAAGPVRAFVDGRPYRGDPRHIPLMAHAQIQLDVGRPFVAPESIAFPPGL